MSTYEEYSLPNSSRTTEGTSPRARRWRASGAYLFVLPALLYLTVVSVYPMAYVFKISLYNKLEKFVGLGNYVRALRDPVFFLGLRQTVIFVVLSTSCHIGLGVLVAVLLNQPMNRLFRNVVRSLIMLPWAVTPVVVGVIWRLLYNPHLSIIASILGSLGLHTRWMPLASTTWALPAVAAANIWFAMPFYMLMLLASLQGIAPELYEAASIDGANMLQRFWHVTMPRLRGTIVTLTMFDFVGAFVFFDLVWTMTRGGPVDSTEVLATYAYRLAFEQFNFGYSAAVAVLMFLAMLVFCLALLPFMQRD